VGFDHQSCRLRIGDPPGACVLSRPCVLFWTRILAWAGVLLVAFGFGGCGRKAPPAAGPGKVLLIGLDGAEWDLIRPMVAAGELPHLARLMKDGSEGGLRSLQSLATSRTIWTTVATGKSPGEHGIGDSETDRPEAGAPETGTPKSGARDGRTSVRGSAVNGNAGQVAESGNHRNVLAVWNIASMAGRTTGVVGWPATHPAERVNGFAVSDFLSYTAEEKEAADGWVNPPELVEEIKPLVTRAANAPWSSVQRFLDAPLDTTAMSLQVEELLAPIRRISAADLSFTRIAERLYREQRPELLAVCLRGIESMGDRYGNYATPDAVPPGTLRPEGLPYLHGAMKAYYRFTDELVGRILDLADARTTILVISDHGFQGEVGRSSEARKVDGIILLAGRNAARGEIAGATVYDVTPTVLVLLGLPPARDMGGKVLWSALGPGIRKETFAATLDTYETGKRATPGGALQSPVDAELKERLRSLGYTN
jgi:hypothetical protein